MRAKQPDKQAYVAHDGVRVRYEVYGDGPETLLFFPSWAITHSRAWKSQLPYFSRYYRCIAFDPRGNGGSDRPDDVAAYGLERYVGDALAILDAEAVEQAVLIGTSYGSLHAALLAAHHPERVRAMVSICGSFTIGADYGTWDRETFEAHFECPEGFQKFNRHYWRENYADFARQLAEWAAHEPHSTCIREHGLAWSRETTAAVLEHTIDARLAPDQPYALDESMYRRIRCPLLLIHGTADQLQHPGKSQAVAAVTGGELLLLDDCGHLPHARFPAKLNRILKDFLDRTLGTPAPEPRRKARGDRRVLYLSSPIGLGHGRRDLAVAQALRQRHPGLRVDWLAQNPVTRLLDRAGEAVHPASALLVSESAHIESEAGEHDLNAFLALRRMDEILIANFMLFQEAVEQGGYDLVIADEAWDVDHFWHEHPELKRTALAWFTDFVGFVPMPEGGAYEADVTADFNAQMIEHIERAPTLRDRAIFVGAPDDIVDGSFGPDLPEMRAWAERHFDFAGYVMGEHPAGFGPRDQLRAELGYRDDERVCIVTVGGSGVGAPLIRRILQAWPLVREKLPDLRLVVVAGPRLDPAGLGAPADVEVCRFVPDLNKHLAACDLALVQGGLTTCMELAAAKTPFIYFPLRNHFEQSVHVHHRLRRYSAGRRLDYAAADPDAIAQAMLDELARPTLGRDVETDGVERAAAMLSELL